MENYLLYCVQELFNKIKTAEFTIPDDGRVSEDTRNVIRRLLVTDPAKRLTATQVRMQGHQGRDPSPAGHRPGQAAHRHTGTHAQSPGTSLGIGNALIYFYLLRPKKAVSAPQSGSFVVIIL